MEANCQTQEGYTEDGSADLSQQFPTIALNQPHSQQRKQQLLKIDDQWQFPLHRGEESLSELATIDHDYVNARQLLEHRVKDSEEHSLGIARRELFLMIVKLIIVCLQVLEFVMVNRLLHFLQVDLVDECPGFQVAAFEEQVLRSLVGSNSNKKYYLQERSKDGETKHKVEVIFGKHELRKQV